MAKKKTIKRPFSDFLDRQATFCLLCEDNSCSAYVDFPADESKGCNLLSSPPIANTLNPTCKDGSLQMFVDYFNIHNRWAKDKCGIDFGTVVDGTVSESNSYVTVKGHFRNALFWVVEPTGDPEDPTLYGTVRAQDICNDPNLKPSLAQGTFHFEFVNPGGPQADLPDIFQFFVKEVDFPLLQRFDIIANGRSVTGKSVHTTQIGLYGNKNCGRENLAGVGDCFPGEIVVVGGGRAL